MFTTENTKELAQLSKCFLFSPLLHLGPLSQSKCIYLRAGLQEQKAGHVQIK